MAAAEECCTVREDDVNKKWFLPSFSQSSDWLPRRSLLASERVASNLAHVLNRAGRKFPGWVCTPAGKLRSSRLPDLPLRVFSG